MRDPSFVNLQALKHMGEGSVIADFIASIAMLDPILGRDRPVSGSQRPGAPSAGTRPSTCGRTPPSCPIPPQVDVPAELRDEIEARMAQVPRPALGRAARAGRRAEGARLVLAARDPPGGRGDAGHARLPVLAWPPSTTCCAPSPSASATCTCAPASPATCATPRPCTTRSPRRRATRSLEGVEVREFECLGACDMAPMASVDGRYVGPLDRGRRARAGGRGEGEPRGAAGKGARRCLR